MRVLNINKKKVLVLILIFIIILCVLLKIIKSKKFNFQEDLIFFKLFGIENIQGKENSNKKNEYKIEVIKGEKNYKKINLFQSIDMETLVYEKVAPGTKGSFYVFLTSDGQIDYEIKIIDKNISPKNLKFEISQSEGRIERNEIKKVKINWEWPYEINKEENIQDTKDGKNIEEFNFEICTIGK